MDNGKQIHISINLGTILKTIVIGLLVWFLFYVKDIVLVVLTSVVLASTMEPLIRWFMKYKVPRVVSVILTYVFIALILLAILYFFIPVFLDDMAKLLTMVPNYVDSISLWNPFKVEIPTESVVAVTEPLSFGARAVNDLSAQASIKDFLRDWSGSFQNLSEGAIKLISSFFGGLFSFILIIVLSFYLAVQEEGITKFLKVIVPRPHENYVVDLWHRSQKKIGYWMQGQVLLGALVGFLVYISLYIISFMFEGSIENPLFLAVLAGVFEIIPLFGPILAAVPAILMAYLGGGLTPMLFVLGAYAMIQQFENHLFYPLVVKKIVGISPIVVIIALIIGGKLAGFLGLILSVPVATAIMEYFTDLEKKKMAKAIGSIRL